MTLSSLAVLSIVRLFAYSSSSAAMDEFMASTAELSTDPDSVSIANEQIDDSAGRVQYALLHTLHL
jgi:hypothetical protein